MKYWSLSFNFVGDAEGGVGRTSSADTFVGHDLRDAVLNKCIEMRNNTIVVMRGHGPFESEEEYFHYVGDCNLDDLEEVEEAMRKWSHLLIIDPCTK